MTFELVRLGWPNAAAVLALAAVPFMSLMLPAGRPPIPNQIQSENTADRQPLGVASIIAE